MSVQLINWLSQAKSFLPWVSFVAGLGGSLHCVGMCGGLVTATCEKSSDVIRYQFGRLSGYLLLGLVASGLGSYLTFKTFHPVISLIPAVMIGCLFIFWGIQNFKGKKAELPTPKILGKVYVQLWERLIRKNKNLTKAFLTGFISIFLPCGLLYGVVLGTLSLEHSYDVLFSMVFFWLGTVPSMVVAPGIIQRLILPLKSKLPKTFAIGLIAIGLMTISLRMVKFYDSNRLGRLSNTQERMTCH